MKLFWVWQDEDVQELDEKIEQSLENNDDIGQLALDILETDVSYNNGVLILQGNRKKPLIFDENVVVRNNECFWWHFSRNIILPENLNCDTIEATMEHNLLVITIQKLHFQESNSIKINRTTY